MAYINDAIDHITSPPDDRVHHVRPIIEGLDDWVCMTCGWQASEPDALYNKAKAAFEREAWGES